MVYEDVSRDYRWLETARWTIGGAGDVNGDGNIDLADAITALQLLSGSLPAGETAMKEADVNGDDRVGAAEAIYILQKMRGLR